MTIPTEVTDLIRGSGNNFHSKVARWLRDDGWHIIVSPYYMDQSQNKAREIDLIAEKLWPTTGVFGTENGVFAVRLFVECKFVPTHSVFWFTRKNLNAANELVGSSGVFRRTNIETKKHHYLAQSAAVAKLFATAGNKAQESEPIYKALNQSLNALVSMRGQPCSVPELGDRSLKAFLQFPVVICSSFENFYGVDFYSEATPTAVEDNFQLEVRYAYLTGTGARRDEYFLLDFVEFGRLQEFSDAINEDARIASFFLSD